MYFLNINYALHNCFYTLLQSSEPTRDIHEIAVDEFRVYISLVEKYAEIAIFPGFAPEEESVFDAEVFQRNKDVIKLISPDKISDDTLRHLDLCLQYPISVFVGFEAANMLFPRYIMAMRGGQDVISSISTTFSL